MAFEDIGSFIFRDILRVYEYCAGCKPFTGEPVTDLVLYLFIPMIFVILIIYMLLARMFPEGYKGIKLLMGIAVFLFIVFSGLFSIFIYLSGPYFIFLLAIVGVAMYLFSHFRPA
ncbi:MAG: hypothetical protein ABIA21_04000 [Candidatus Aenigmatarchaeota archaeon]